MGLIFGESIGNLPEEVFQELVGFIEGFDALVQVLDPLTDKFLQNMEMSIRRLKSICHWDKKDIMSLMEESRVATARWEKVNEKFLNPESRQRLRSLVLEILSNFQSLFFQPSRNLWKNSVTIWLLLFLTMNYMLPMSAPRYRFLLRSLRNTK